MVLHFFPDLWQEKNAIFLWSLFFGFLLQCPKITQAPKIGWKTILFFRLSAYFLGQFQGLHQRGFPRGHGCLLAWSWFWSLPRPPRGSWKGLNVRIFGGSIAAPKIPGDVWKSCGKYGKSSPILPRDSKCFFLGWWKPKLANCWVFFWSFFPGMVSYICARVERPLVFLP